MVLPARYSQQTPGWYSNPTMPNFEDYAADPAGYDAAVQAWVAAQNGGPAGTAPTIDPVTGWRSAGSQRMADMTQGEYDANYLNSRMAGPAAHVLAGNPDHPDNKMFQLAMHSRNQVRPEQFGSAYNAASAGLGGPSPILNDAMLNFLEQNFGYGPPPAATPPGGAASGDGKGGRPGTQAGGGTPPAKDPNAGPATGFDPGQTNRNPGIPGAGFGPGPSGPGGGNGIFDPSTGPVGLPHLGAGGYLPVGTPSTGMLPPNLGGVPGDYSGMSQAGGNPDTIARFREFMRMKQQMQPPIHMTGQGY